MKILLIAQGGDGGGMFGGQVSAGDEPQPAATVPAAKPEPISVPLSFLAQPDDQEQMQTPAKGNTGSMSVDYTVVDIQGDNALVQPTAVNGNDLGAAEQESETDPDAAEGADLQQQAAQMSNPPAE